ncbi:MAG: RNA-binding protein [Solobacterium sp.]|nr:RNA-binding protein [Solobacterium sp.]
MTNAEQFSSLIAHLYDLKEKAELWHKPMISAFLSEEELQEVMQIFPPSKTTIYDGGYAEARKKRVIFLYDEGDDFSLITCIKAKIDQRFRKISHRDVLGALMSLQIERDSLGDFWIEDDWIYLYTSETMAEFICLNLHKINQLSVSFMVTQEHPEQIFHTKDISCIIASERMDAIVAALAHQSRAKAKDMIHAGLVHLNHRLLEDVDELCHNNYIISIRGVGRFTYVGCEKTTRSGRLVALFKQSI